MENLGQFIVNHWQLWLALIIILILIFINEFISQKKQAKRVSPAAAVDLMNHEQAIVIDLRDAEAFRSGHIIDAVRLSADDFNQQRADKYKDKTIILVCVRGIQASALANKLRTQGFKEPIVLAGGMTAWNEANLPIVKGK